MKEEFSSDEISRVESMKDSRKGGKKLRKPRDEEDSEAEVIQQSKKKIHERKRSEGKHNAKKQTHDNKKSDKK